MKIRAGDLVKAASIVGYTVDLSSSPNVLLGTGVITGRLGARDCGLALALDRSDGRCVYVIGSNGCGWTFGAFLDKVLFKAPDTVYHDPHEDTH